MRRRRDELEGAGAAAGVSGAHTAPGTSRRTKPRKIRLNGRAVAVTIAIALDGCTSISVSGQMSSPDSTRQADCVRNGGRWHPGSGAYAFCEVRP